MQLFVLLVYAKQQKFDTDSIINQIMTLLKGSVSILIHEKAPKDICQQSLSILSSIFQLIRQYLGENFGQGDGDDNTKIHLKFISGDIYKTLLTKLQGDEKALIYDHISHLLAIFCNNTSKWSELDFNTVYESLHEGLEISWNQQFQSQSVTNLMNIFALLTMLAMKW